MKVENRVQMPIKTLSTQKCAQVLGKMQENVTAFDLVNQKYQFSIQAHLTIQKQTFYILMYPIYSCILLKLKGRQTKRVVRTQASLILACMISSKV